MFTTFVAVLFVALLVLEWRREPSGRIAAVVLALVVLYVAQPIAHRALRRALVLPAAERDTVFAVGGGRLSEYESGVVTMRRMVVEDWGMGAGARAIALGVLVWLSVVPAFRSVGPRRAAGVPAPHVARTPGDGSPAPEPPPDALDRTG